MPDDCSQSDLLAAKFAKKKKKNKYSNAVGNGK